MKLNLRHRIILLVGALFVLVIGVVVIVAGLQFQQIDLSVDFFSVKRLAILLSGLLLIVYALYVILLPKRLKQDQEHFIVQQTAGGELRISMKAIENIVKKCVDVNPDMRLVEMNVAHARNGVRVDLRIALPGNISIPLAVESLQKQIKKQIQAAAGIDDADVRVSVETAEHSVSEATYRVEEPTPIISEPVLFDGNVTNSAEESGDANEREDESVSGVTPDMENEAQQSQVNEESRNEP